MRRIRRIAEIIVNDPALLFVAGAVVACIGLGLYALLRSAEGSAADQEVKTTAVVLTDLKGSKLRLITRPALYPNFHPRVRDYVVKCPGEKMQVRARAPRVGDFVADGERLSKRRWTDFELSPGQAVRIELEGAERDGAYWIRCLPADFPKWKFERRGDGPWALIAVSPGMGDPEPSRYATIFDEYGVPVWWHRADTPSYDTKVLPDGTIAWSRAFSAPYGLDERMAQEIHVLDGSTERVIGAVGKNGVSDHHDFQLLNNGNYMHITYQRRPGTINLRAYGGPDEARVVDGVLEEVTPEGQLVWRWSSARHVKLNELEPHWEQILDTPVEHSDGTRRYDLVHLNSVAEVSDDRLLLSMRRPDAVYMIDRSTGNVIWKLGGTETPKSLRVIGDPGIDEGPLGSQHDARWLGDGLVSVYDNSSGLKRSPRAVLFRVDEERDIARFVEQRTDPLVKISGCCGSARRHPDGGWVVGWGTPITTAFNEHGQIAWRLDFGERKSYRAVPVEEATVTRAELRAGMNAAHPRP